jgi:hypothetical protein
MSLPAIALKTALRDALLADAPLAVLLGGPRIHDEVPRGQPAPFILFGDTVTRDASTNSGRAHETVLTLFALSNQGGQREAQAMAARIEAVLHDAALTLSGHRLVSLALLTSEARRERGNETTRATLKFRAYTEPN